MFNKKNKIKKKRAENLIKNRGRFLIHMKKIVSFIVPALNKEKNIKDTIDTIERNVPCENLDYEIVVVDGGSVDRTVEIVNSITKENGKAEDKCRRKY